MGDEPGLRKRWRSQDLRSTEPEKSRIRIRDWMAEEEAEVYVDTSIQVTYRKDEGEKCG
jgi:hypothetical protein